jgi:hypothetical protein
MNRMTEALIAGVITGLFNVSVMAFKGMNPIDMLAVFLQYILGSYAIFFVPLKLPGWLKGLAVAVICAVPIAIFVSLRDPSGSLIAGFIMFGLSGILGGIYAARAGSTAGAGASISVVGAVLVGLVAGSFHAAVAYFKGMGAETIAAALIQYVIAANLIFYVPLKAPGWLKGLIIGCICAVPLLIVILHYEASGSVISGILISSIMGSLAGTYGAHKENK